MKYFIKSSDFANKVKMSKSIKDSELIPFIRSTQITHLKRILGDALYDELQTQMIANVLSAENILLFPYIVDVHVYYSYQEYLLWANANPTEYGLVSKNAAESEDVPADQLYKFINWAKGTGDSFCYELRKFLYKNSADYPLWMSCVNSFYYDNYFESGTQWINVGKNLAGKRNSVKEEEAAKKFDFNTAYGFWCKHHGYTV